MWELNRATFRRLVRLQIVTLFACIFAAFRMELASSWVLFDVAFSVAADRQFGPDAFGSDATWPLMTILGILSLWMLASMVGLLWFRTWARFGFWASALALTMVSAWNGERPSYDAPLDDALGFVNSAAFGAIVLLSYAKGYGAEWFAPQASKIRE